MNVLLVEPGYKNKYPPLSLMKISTYHKQRGDTVHFVKGIDANVTAWSWDRIYITTLFTFDFDITVKTIRHYKKLVRSTEDIYVGGIMATLMNEKLKETVGLDTVIKGRLFSSSMLGFDDDINIDCLPLDYDILDQIQYQYPAGDNYFGYTTRGCPNGCAFCAVPTLEPDFESTNHVYEHVCEINQRYGEKKDLLLLDNNILYSPDLEQIVTDIQRAGFVKIPTFIKPTPYEKALNKLTRRPLYDKEVKELLTWMKQFSKRIRNEQDKEVYLKVLASAIETEDVPSVIKNSQEVLYPIVEKYKSKAKSQRYVDFNQGTDARLLTDEKMEILSRIPIRPLRIAFDSISEEERYVNAVRLAHRYDVKEISNYLLYNFKDKPVDLWKRLKINLELKGELDVNIFSFPMKYIPITDTDRNFLGEYWNRKYIRAIQAILLVKKGIVSTHKSFFEKAFGKTEEEYAEILMMPEDFIIYRFDFEGNGLAFEWKNLYQSMDTNERAILLDTIKNNKADVGDLLVDLPSKVRKILPYYQIRHKNR